MTRRDLSNRAIVVTVAIGGLAVSLYFSVRPALPQAWHIPGTPPLYLAGVSGSLMLLVPAVFAIVKRSGLTENPTAWFVAHVIASVGGAVLIAIHTAGSLERPPALMLIGIVFLVVQGAWARTSHAHTVSATFGRQLAGFAPADPERREQLRQLIDRKVALLARFDPGANEGTFSLTPGHWLGHPSLAARYHHLVAAERRALGHRDRLPRLQAYWRVAHMLVAWALVAGLIVHVGVVTFFAGYAADGQAIYWWHVSDW